MTLANVFCIKYFILVKYQLLAAVDTLFWKASNYHLYSSIEVIIPHPLQTALTLRLRLLQLHFFLTTVDADKGSLAVVQSW